MRLAFVFILLSASLAAQPASIEGTVLNHATGQPMAGVHVRLLSSDFEYGARVTAYGAMSDTKGHFSIAGIETGMYSLYPEFVGFILIPMEKSGNSVPLRAGQNLADYRFEMTPVATISGRVVDDFGDPVQRVGMELEPLSSNGFRDLPFGWMNNSSNDLGEFHLAAAPGRYYVRAQVSDQPQQSAPEIRTDGSSSAPYSSTYYPAAASKSAASAVELTSGHDLAGIVIHLMRAGADAGHTLSISGVVTALPDNKILNVSLSHGEGLDRPWGATWGASTPAVQPDGSFAFHNLEPGAYRLFAHDDSSKPAMRSPSVEITLTGAGETGVQLAIVRPQELSGVLEIGEEATAAAKRTVSLVSVGYSYDDNSPEPSPAPVEKDGTFRIADVSPGRFRAVIAPLPENGYIQSVALDGMTAENGVVELNHGAQGSHLKVTVKTDGAQITGRVLDQDGAPVVSPLVMIFLATDSKELIQMNPDEMNKAVDAKYAVKSIRPGKYRLLAVDTASMAATVSNSDDEADLAKRVFDAGEEIEIKAGDRIVKDLKAIQKVPDKGKEPQR